jgi:hypothetical protein
MKRLSLKKILIAALLLIVVHPSFAARGSTQLNVPTLRYQCTHYVSTDGSDTNPGTQSQPWRTIQHAADQSLPSDEICIQPGTYEERVVIRNSGTLNAPITFQGLRSASDEWSTIIDGSNPVPKGIWTDAPEVGFGVWKTTSFSYDPHNMIVLDTAEPDVNRQWKQIGHIIDRTMKNGQARGTGFENLSMPPDATVDLEFTGATISYWDGVEAMFGSLDGTTYIRFRNGENPDSHELRSSPDEGAVVIDNASYVVFRDFRIQGARNGVIISGSNAKHNVLEDNLLLHGHNRVVLEEKASFNHIRRNEMTMNYIYDGFGPHDANPINEHVYRQFKYVYGPSGSDDRGVKMYDEGEGNEIYRNDIHNGLIGVIVWGLSGEVKDTRIYDNVIYNHSSIGVALILEQLTNVQVYDNLIYNANINIRPHHYNDPASSGSSVYVYRNRLHLPIDLGSHIYVHWYDTGIPSGFIHPDIWFYHNSFAGGDTVPYLSYLGMDHGMLNTRFINNVFSSDGFLSAKQPGWHEPDRIDVFDYNWVGGKQRYTPNPAWFGPNNIEAWDEQMWDASSIPDFKLPAGSAALNAGIDLSSSFTIDGRTYDPLPGMEDGYFAGDRPDLGAIQSNVDAPTFVDVPFDHWAHDYIELLYQEGFVSGCNAEPLMYCPDVTMTRAESAVFVQRGVHGAHYMPDPPSGATFTDVPLWEWFAKWANGLWVDGYTAGCGTDPLIFCPMQEHTRTEGAVFFLRMMHGPDYVPPEPVGKFADVNVNFWGAKWIEAAYSAGLIPACETSQELRFCPSNPLDRAMAAYMMVQAKGLSTP